MRQITRLENYETRELFLTQSLNNSEVQRFFQSLSGTESIPNRFKREDEKAMDKAFYLWRKYLTTVLDTEDA